MEKKKNQHKDVVVPENDMAVDSFRAYKASDDDKTKIEDGEKAIESFHLYKEDKE